MAAAGKGNRSASNNQTLSLISDTRFYDYPLISAPSSCAVSQSSEEMPSPEKGKRKRGQIYFCDLS